MPRIIEGPPEPGAVPKPLLHRLGWFALIWLASVAVVAAVAYALRALIL
jgi:hypothetical protein